VQQQRTLTNDDDRNWRLQLILIHLTAAVQMCKW